MRIKGWDGGWGEGKGGGRGWGEGSSGSVPATHSWFVSVMVRPSRGASGFVDSSEAYSSSSVNVCLAAAIVDFSDFSDRCFRDVPPMPADVGTTVVTAGSTTHSSCFRGLVENVAADKGVFGSIFPGCRVGADVYHCGCRLCGWPVLCHGKQQ